MRVFVTSDTHFSHKNILKFNPRTRPWESAHDMNVAMTRRWNEVVSPDDMVFHLGDFAFCGFEKALNIALQLNGKIVLIRGNHDQIFRKDQNIKKALESRKFLEIVDYFELRHKGEFVVMNHYAMRVWNKSHHGAYHLFGHSHGSLEGQGRSVDVGIDSSELDCKGGPILLDEVINYLRSADPLLVDHHNKDTN